MHKGLFASAVFLNSSDRQSTAQVLEPVYLNLPVLHVVQSVEAPAEQVLQFELHFVHNGLFASAVFLYSSVKHVVKQVFEPVCLKSPALQLKQAESVPASHVAHFEWHFLHLRCSPSIERHSSY